MKYVIIIIKMSILKNILCNLNKHERDENISFEEKEHKYTILDEGSSTTPYISTTTFIHKHFEEFDSDTIIDKMFKGRNWNINNKYWGMNKEEIKKLWSDNSSMVSKEGTNLHFDIECFMNQELKSNIKYTHKNLYKNYFKKNNIQNTNIEWKYFLNFINYFPNFKPYRTEWLIYDSEVKIAGSIDMVYKNKDNSISIFDWKRTKKIDKTNAWNKYSHTECISHLPDSNFWHYTLQLNIYRYILEKNYNENVKDLYLVRLHPNNTNQSFELIKIPILIDEIKDLFEYRKSNLKYN